MSDDHSVSVGVQLVQLEDSGEIGWGANLIASLGDRAADIDGAVRAGVSTIANSLQHLRAVDGWAVDSVEATFGIALTAEGGVIIAKAEVGTTLEVKVSFTRTKDGQSS